MAQYQSALIYYDILLKKPTWQFLMELLKSRTIIYKSLTVRDTKDWCGHLQMAPKHQQLWLSDSLLTPPAPEAKINIFECDWHAIRALQSCVSLWKDHSTQQTKIRESTSLFLSELNVLFLSDESSWLFAWQFSLSDTWYGCSTFTSLSTLLPLLPSH